VTPYLNTKYAARQPAHQLYKLQTHLFHSYGVNNDKCVRPQYADDIVLLAPSVGILQTLLALLETLLENLDTGMRINAFKSACIRFGLSHDADCANLTMKNGEAVAWVSTCRYLGLGVYFVSGHELRCCFDQAIQKFCSFI